jgi:hypothetical protein
VLRSKQKFRLENTKMNNNENENPYLSDEDVEHICRDVSVTGTDDLIELSDGNNVYISERINLPIHVPSVFSDVRGEIHNLLIGNKRINLLHTKKGVMRSGDIHKDTQHDFIISGQIHVWTLVNVPCDIGNTNTKRLSIQDFTTKRIYNAMEYVSIPPYTPHIFEFLGDTIMAEWWDGPFYAWLYRPYRSIVERSSEEFSKLITNTAGQFSHYEIKSHSHVKQRNSTLGRFYNYFGLASQHPKIWWSGVLFGISIGYILAKRK